MQDSDWCGTSQMTAIAKPELLKKVSEVLLGIGGSLDRGHSSARLRHTIGSKLTAEELYAFDNVMRRITSLATALVQKVGRSDNPCLKKGLQITVFMPDPNV